jgi:REP element-mobilizing transposase RayT
VIRQFNLLLAGHATKTDSTRSLAAEAHDHRARLDAKQLLKYPAVQMAGIQARQAVRGVAEAVDDHGYRIHALAVMPDHVHIVMAWHRRHIDDIARHIKARMTRRMSEADCHPLAEFTKAGRTPSPWARNYWCPYIRDVRQMLTAIEYVERNPVKAGYKAQRWAVIVPYDV